MVAIVGASGVGKSTLLQLIGGLDRAQRGRIVIDGTDVAGLDDDALVAFRHRAIGFVFQFHHLLPEFSATENVEMPMRIGRRPPAEARGRAEALLAEVGLGDRSAHRPGMLSGGEQQRVRPGARAGDAAGAPAGGRADRRSGRDYRRPDAGADPRNARGARAHLDHGHPQCSARGCLRSGAAPRQRPSDGSVMVPRGALPADVLARQKIRTDGRVHNCRIIDCNRWGHDVRAIHGKGAACPVLRAITRRANSAASPSKPSTSSSA